MQLKQLSLTLALAGMLSTQVYAHEAATEAAPLAAAPVQAAPANVLTQDDLVALFGAEEAGKPLQLAVLSEQEIVAPPRVARPTTHETGVK
jgi:methionine-rich copper-binding protein CopC